MYCGVTIMASESCSNESFMEEVRKYPWLYDKFCKDFKEKSLKLNSWKAVGDKYEYTGNYCRIPRYLTVFGLPTSNTEYAQIPSNTVIWEVALMSTIGRKPTIPWLRSGAAGQNWSVVTARYFLRKWWGLMGRLREKRTREIWRNYTCLVRVFIFKSRCVLSVQGVVKGVTGIVTQPMEGEEMVFETCVCVRIAYPCCQ